MSLDITAVTYEEVRLNCPPLEEIANVLSHGLKKNFSRVHVHVVDCPDLTKPPFTLAREGLCGRTTVMEVGGVPYLLPLPNRDKLYDLKELANTVGYHTGLVIGAGAGPWPYVGVNCELIANLSLDDDIPDNQTRIARINPETKGCDLLIPPSTETRHALLANLFMCEGKPGKVVKVHCKVRTGKDDFVTAIRKSLEDRYKSEPVGLGGTFLLKAGKARQHIMSDFSSSLIRTEDQLNRWLNFYDMSAPLIAVGTIMSADPGIDLRMQHFHSFSHHGEGGHYHNDTTPETVEYVGYFNVGVSIVRIDRPLRTHQFGRD